MIRKILLFLLLALIVIQFIHPPKNQAAGAQPNYIGNKFSIPADVKELLKVACNDCHSNNTRYPWYSKLQPLHWWLNSHVKKGKKGLNFDEYTHRPLRYQYHKMEEVIEMVKEGEMPLKSYTWTHKDARLSADEKSKITAWAGSVMDNLKSNNPIDSLIRKK
jgi:Haem-binding domain